MSKLKNSIGWCDATGNPVIGCRGCELRVRCYARNDTPARVLRAGKWPGMNGRKVETFGPGSERVPTKKGLSDLHSLNKLCICDGCHRTAPASYLTTPNTHCVKTGGDYCGIFRRIRYFADSNSDWMDWPVEILARALDQIRQAPNVDVILCTKWPENFFPLIQTIWRGKAGSNPELSTWLANWEFGNDIPKNIILLTSVTTPKTIVRAENLLKIPAAVHGLSMEPLWDNVSLRWLAAFNGMATRPRPQSTNEYDGLKQLGWIIVGGESGKGRRDCGVEAIVSVADQCVAAGVPVYVKQDCAGKAGQKGRIPDEIWKLKQFPNS